MSSVENFPVLLSEAEEESSAVPPCFSHEGINYLYIRHNNLYLLALTKRNTNAAEILLFLHKIVEVFTEYFKELEEESIRDNFVVIYELLDEMMDFGYPQTTESKILQEYVYRIHIQLLFSHVVAKINTNLSTQDTSLKNHTSSRSKPGHLLPLQMLSVGEAKVFATVKMKSSSTSWSLSICWLAHQATCCVPRF